MNSPDDLEFTPLTIDLDTYEARIALEEKVKELAQAKVVALEAVYQQAFDENFDAMLVGLQPIIPADEETLETMAIKAFHQFKVEQSRASREFKRGVYTVSLYGLISSLTVAAIGILIFRLSISKSLAIGLLTSPVTAPILALRNN